MTDSSNDMTIDILQKRSNCGNNNNNKNTGTRDDDSSSKITRKYPLRRYILGSGAPGTPGVNP